MRSPGGKKDTTSGTSPVQLSPQQRKPPATCHSKRLLPPAPEILPDRMQGEEGARRALLIVIGTAVAALLVDQIVHQWRR